MLFNSLEFLNFFVITYVLYLLLPLRGQNTVLLFASYFFYAAWDPRYLILIFISTCIDFVCGLRIERSASARLRSFFLGLSIITNLTILGVFKYYDFFAANLAILGSKFGITLDPVYLDIILPVGISFYTFQSMSYTIDVYRRRISATDRFTEFALFVAFFPQLLAGPIETGRHLLPQMFKKRTISLPEIYEGSFLIFWGLFEKIVVADTLRPLVLGGFGRGEPVNGLELLLLVYAGTFLLLCDFDGYSNIARGLGKLMGFDILVNFRFPYLSTNPLEFWRRWHISLSSWFRDYVYLPLRGGSHSPIRLFLSVCITFFLAGLWHGAQWTFVLWGVFHGLLLVTYRLILPIVRKVSPRTAFGQKAWLICRIVFFFNVWGISGVLFTAPSIQDALICWRDLFFNFSLELEVFTGIGLTVLIFTAIPILVQIIQYREQDLLAVMKLHPLITGFFYFVCFYMIVFYSGAANDPDFYYFQF